MNAPAILSPQDPYLVGSLLHNASDAVAAFVMSKIEGAYVLPGTYYAIGVIRDGKLCGGVVYYNYEPREGNVFVHIASDNPRWFLPETARGLFSYPFIDLDCIRITAMIARRNKRCRDFTKGLGFREEGCVRKGFLKRDDLMIYGLLREEAAERKWIRSVARQNMMGG